ncbi:hypothetical protein QBC34DRAFT_379752 [Podospora aff. communis PSN243]|uniref:Uncharacterized protein n=1 Tax=Podospora aff. communis PSN243 TaxID=3040156 RepID=A0AAV9GPH4_9PEZI|nr:hypothetical protein QBC34DRAFT_379752 [Podospora aff. communis PSN243]
MKSYALLFSVGLASAQVLQAGGVNNLNLGANSLFNSTFNVNGNAADFDPASLGINLADLNTQGFNFANLDFGNQNAMAQAIQVLLGQLCLANALDFNNIIGLGLNNQLDLFLQLAQLQQLQNLGFIGLGGAAALFNSGRIFGGGFNVGFFKRELQKAKKMMKRTKLRRGQRVTKRQCQGVNSVQPGVAGANAVDTGAVTIATANPSAAFTIATAAPPVAVATPVVAAATPAAVATVAPVAAVPEAALPAPAPAAAPVAAPVAVASNIPAAAPVAEVAPDAGLAAPVGGEENLADFTR